MKSTLDIALQDPAFVEWLRKFKQTANYFFVAAQNGQVVLDLCLAYAYLAGKKEK